MTPVRSPQPDPTRLPIAEFVPLLALERTARFGWLVVLCMLIGGLLGWVYKRIQPPLYESQVGFTVSYDLSNMGAMTQFEQDHVSGAVGDLLVATDVMQSVVDDARAQGIDLDLVTLKSISTHERMAQIWYVRIRHPNPVIAARLANIWGERANQTLKQAYQQGVKAQALQRSLDALEGCLTRSVQVEPAGGICSLQSQPELQKQMAALEQPLVDAKLASRGVLPSLVLDWSERAQVAQQPTSLNQGLAVFVGALAGLVLSIWLINVGLPERFLRRSVRGSF